MLSNIGSLASILGLLVSIYVLWREIKIQKEVEELKSEEETWHKQ